ncbi:ABC transporter ATP-binding protein [Paenibacillus sp. IB182496]|uniref:ABC transporter ATP-binding protein n=1 Tax=Paenibacillus sabuli TaxID=2772509 RepID=A0A927GS63_9BACL|nr:ABC transporter ATP-binding protein [Paenibacillus sabuli]MBD2845387.1 ABC transporter ATP-binding protein [Paenibacillus sabuli]
MTASLLEVTQLQTQFKTSDGLVPSVNRISFTVEAGETLALVGESGSGKSVTSLSIMGLIAEPGRIAGGEVRLDGVDLLQLSRREMRRLRGSKLSIIFQEPMTSLNPVFRVGRQIAEVIRKHEKVDKREAHRRSVDMLEKVGISGAERIAASYPHQLSGGMRQRVMIAIALACRPKLLIADEPTTALDVTIQAQILTLIRALSQEANTGVILITHDLGVVAEMADRVAVMYAGEIVEQAPVNDLFDRPMHPYTVGLMNSLPRLRERRDRLDAIPGMVPSLLELPQGCPFHPRCAYAEDRCRQIKPELLEHAPGHLASCHRAEEVKR